MYYFSRKLKAVFILDEQDVCSLEKVVVYVANLHDHKETDLVYCFLK
jgi:hypothetical protein